jgi:soluble lytic murein transglycosylase-like protein
MAYTRDQLKQIVIAAADRYGINQAVALAQINQESGFKATVCSSAGACGIAQFIPGTAARFGLTDRTDPVASMDAWGRYMTQMLGQFNNRLDVAVAGYNWGENRATLRKAVQENRSVLNYSLPNETRNYVTAIFRNAGFDPSQPIYNDGTPSGLPASIFPGSSTGKWDTTTILFTVLIAWYLIKKI